MHPRKFTHVVDRQSQIHTCIRKRKKDWSPWFEWLPRKMGSNTRETVCSSSTAKLVQLLSCQKPHQVWTLTNTKLALISAVNAYMVTQYQICNSDVSICKKNKTVFCNREASFLLLGVTQVECAIWNLVFPCHYM